MAFTPSLIGRVIGNNVTSLSISVGSTVAAGSKIYVLLGTSAINLGSISDTAGNNYRTRAATQPGPSVFLWAVDSSIQLLSGGSISVTPLSGTFSGSMAAFSATGLSSGAITGSSSGFGNSTSPLVVLPNTPSGDYVVGVVAVSGPSADGFSQDANFLAPGNINTQSTTNFSAYVGYRLIGSAGEQQYQPTLGVARAWAALLIQFSP